MTEINIGDYCFDETEIPTKRAEKTEYQVRHDQRFICVPESWVIKVFELVIQRQTGGPLIAGLILWQRYHMAHGRQPVKLSGYMLGRFRVKRRSVNRWLYMLERAGLIAVCRLKYRSPEITIITNGGWKNHGFNKTVKVSRLR